MSQEAAFTQVFLTDLTKETKNRLLEEEGQMAAADSLQRATDEAKNALEEYVYSLRSKVQGECAAFVKEADGAALVTELNDLENWLYEDGEDEKKSVRAFISCASTEKAGCGCCRVESLYSLLCCICSAVQNNVLGL